MVHVDAVETEETVVASGEANKGALSRELAGANRSTKTRNLRRVRWGNGGGVGRAQLVWSRGRGVRANS